MTNENEILLRQETSNNSSQQIKPTEAPLNYKEKIIDCLMFLIYVSPFIVTLVIFHFYISPFKSPLNTLDPFINNPKLPEPISMNMLFLILSILPVLIISFFNLITALELLKCLVVAILSANTITDVLKVNIGRFRPDFMARCNLNTNQTVIPADLIFTVCNNTAKRVREGMLSFPSGHSSSAFASAITVSLFIVCFTFQNKRFIPVRLFLAACPLLFALVVATTRIQCNAHHPTDVIAGIVIGTFTSLITFVLYFPNRE